MIATRSMQHTNWFQDVSCPLSACETHERTESSMFDPGHKSCRSTNSPDLKVAE